MRSKITLLALNFLLFLFFAAPCPAQEPADRTSIPAAKIGDETITIEELYRAAVAANVQEAARLGASGTPTFFINGRMLVGAKPLTAFQKLIDSELARESVR